ncbi:MAG: hypothetical protein J6X70_03845 [Muribaculaceae bacterium]|nr:hypothetical protein [Muribaculaceae bacterium]
MTIYYFESNNRSVTSYYLGTIIEALRNCGFHVAPLPDISVKHVWKLSRKRTWFLTTGHKDIATLSMMGFGNFIHWFQGLPAEEDYMRTHSLWRKRAIGMLDRTSAKRCRFAFFVSEQMRDYYRTRFGAALPHSFIMPCFNEQLNPDAFFTPGKYEQNTFCYVGSATDAWQCFDEMVTLYSQIEAAHPDCRLKIITRDADEAQAIADAHDLRNVTIKSVEQQQVAHEIADCKFGFLLRKNHIVNNVATPTKMANYLANGVMPIFSDALSAYAPLAQQHPFMHMVNESNVRDMVEQAVKATYDPHQVLNAYQQIFDTHFNRSRYVTDIQSQLQQFFDDRQE